MNYSFKKNPSRNFSKILCMLLAVLMLTVIFAGCQKKESPVENETDPVSPPNLIENNETEPNDPEESTEPVETEPEKGNVAIVKEQVNVRSSPSSESNIIGQLDAGDEVEINRIETVSGTQWAYIPLKGWVTVENLDMTHVTTAPIGSAATPANPEATEPSEENTPGNATVANGNSKKGVVTGSQLNVRSEANTTSKIVATLNYGTRLTILETKDGWGKIDKGWVNMSYVYLDGTRGKNSCSGTVTGSQLNIRSGPGTNYDSVGSLAKNERVEILEQITVGKITWGCTLKGWVSMNYVTPDGTVDESTSGNGTITGSNVNIRKGPGTDNDVVGSYSKGDKVEITSQQTVGKTKWGCTDKGWVSMDYVEMD